MERRDLIRDVLQAAGEFNSRKLWKRFTNSDCFGVRIAGEDELILGVVLGGAGEEYGLSLFRGPKAAASFAALLDSEGLVDDVVEDMDMLSFTMVAFGDLPPEDQSLMRKVGQHPCYDEKVPHFLAKPPACRARFPDESELSLLLLVLRGVVEADKKRLLQPARLGDEDGICILTLGGGAGTLQMFVTQEHWQPSASSVEPPLEGAKTIPLPPERLDLRGLPRLDATWLVGMPTVPAGIQGDDRSMQVLLVVDEASEYVIQGRPVLGGDLGEAMKIVGETFRGGGLGGQKGLPRKMVFSSRKLHDAMAPILEPAGVKCTYESTIPKLQRIVADLVAHVASGPPSFAEDMEAPGVLEAEVPAPDDLRGWKEADLRLARRFAEHFEFGEQLWSSRAVKRYFDDDNLESHLKEHKERAVVPAYTAWGILDYRPNKTSKTYAEKMLAKGLPEPEAILLRARMEACPTLYRVAGHDPKAGTIDLEDVLLGGTATVYDQMMSENIENNLFFAARVFPVGHFHFVELAGPPLGMGMGLEAVEFLRGCGMEFTPQGLRRDAHMFGWLWKWIDQWRANRKSARLCNTDGEEFLWHTASFSVANPEDTRQALLGRQDIQHDDQEDEFVWSKETSRDSKMLGETVTLGRIEFVGDELVITVNSAKRFSAARQWLQELPGVVFRSVTTRRWDEAEKDRPLDERIAKPEPVEMTPELNAAVQEMMDKHYKAWIDAPLPILGGKTPRQACKTEAGRQQVTMLIRTMPDPLGRGSVRAPREVMLRELGLTTEAPTPPPVAPQTLALPLPIQAVPASHKVARNAPCPCGSGRKYKKCCGR
jgi:hypothetical protein